MNRIILIGRVSSKPVFMTTKSNVNFIRFNLAIDRRKYNQNSPTITDFIPVVAWRQNATLLDKLITVGSLIAIEGSLQANRVMSNTTNYLTNYEVNVDYFRLLETKEQLEMRRQKLAQKVSEPTFEPIFDDFQLPQNNKRSFHEDNIFQTEPPMNFDETNIEISDDDRDPFAEWEIDDLDPNKLN
ncbi:single-stranded DNA-binding protein [Mesomycoplasma ovipneumoniae]|uniref:single-stranded DNA-binding protein n=1 Tax=Mesomycoplasma ovipneumoniae TaxID=29562 RepID=UPI0020CFCB36|nr:single-stranded DNA-binding protein [Mesomycoplasma ovipneumoniae]MCP9306332.1 single-stranded DNA-binding protein [Mesomycoplasma ovipneumoniae]